MHLKDGDDAVEEVQQKGPAESISTGHAGEEHGIHHGSPECEEGQYLIGSKDEDVVSDEARKALHLEKCMRASILKKKELEEQISKRKKIDGPEYEAPTMVKQREEEFQAAKAALKKASVKKMREELKALDRNIFAEVPVPGETPRDTWRQLGDGTVVLAVPTKPGIMDTFDPAIWTKMEPQCFFYGDGVFGIERDTPLPFREWVSLLLERDELEYSGGQDWNALATSSVETVETSLPVPSQGKDYESRSSSCNDATTSAAVVRSTAKPRSSGAKAGPNGHRNVFG